MKDKKKTVVEDARSCRWYDPGKYFQWAGNLLVNNLGEFLTLSVLDEGLLSFFLLNICFEISSSCLTFAFAIFQLK